MRLFACECMCACVEQGEEETEIVCVPSEFVDQKKNREEIAPGEIGRENVCHEYSPGCEIAAAFLVEMSHGSDNSEIVKGQFSTCHVITLFVH